VHTSEERKHLVLVKDQSNGNIVHLALVLGFVPLKLLNDPEATVWLRFVRLLDELLSDGVIEVLGLAAGIAVGPVKDLLVNISALGKLHVESIKIGISLTSCNMDGLRGLELNSHRGCSDWGLSKIKLIQSIVDVLSDRDVVHSAGARLCGTV